jgi:A/G-specific adenine glycosylase
VRSSRRRASMSSPDPLKPSEKRRLKRLAKDIVDWSHENGRDFPWRSSEAGIYQQVVVEVLLQRTTAAAVGRFFDKFIAQYPGWEELASAEIGDLEQFLKPLGLWRRRAQSLLGIARYAADNDGLFPCDPGDHRDIPAVGQYVSNAILQFQHGRAAPLLDVNMARVIERFQRPRRLADIRHDPWLQDAAHWLVRGDRSREVNWAVLDFAALICRARNPRCDTCPVSNQCNYARASRGQSPARAAGV